MRSLRHISIGSLLLGLDDLLGKRLAALKSAANGAANEDLLKAKRDEINALPPAVRGAPLADEIAAADWRHDGIGKAIWFIVQGHLTYPDTTPAKREAAKRIQAALIPSLDELAATYEAEAKAAKGRKVELPSLKADLDMFPVADNVTLYDWAAGFVAAGESIDVLLSERADAKDRAAASSLRSETIGILNRLRKSMESERKNNASLPSSLDDDVFAYFDQLEAKAAEAAAEEKKKAAAKAAKKEAAGGDAEVK